MCIFIRIFVLLLPWIVFASSPTSNPILSQRVSESGTLLTEIKADLYRAVLVKQSGTLGYGKITTTNYTLYYLNSERLLLEIPLKDQKITLIYTKQQKDWILSKAESLTYKIEYQSLSNNLNADKMNFDGFKSENPPKTSNQNQCSFEIPSQLCSTPNNKGVIPIRELSKDLSLQSAIDPNTCQNGPNCEVQKLNDAIKEIQNIKNINLNKYWQCLNIAASSESLKTDPSFDKRKIHEKNDWYVYFNMLKENYDEFLKNQEVIISCSISPEVTNNNLINCGSYSDKPKVSRDSTQYEISLNLSNQNCFDTKVRRNFIDQVQNTIIHELFHRSIEQVNKSIFFDDTSVNKKDAHEFHEKLDKKCDSLEKIKNCLEKNECYTMSALSTTTVAANAAAPQAAQVLTQRKEFKEATEQSGLDILGAEVPQSKSRQLAAASPNVFIPSSQELEKLLTPSANLDAQPGLQRIAYHFDQGVSSLNTRVAAFKASPLLNAALATVSSTPAYAKTKRPVTPSTPTNTSTVVAAQKATTQTKTQANPASVAPQAQAITNEAKTLSIENKPVADVAPATSTTLASNSASATAESRKPASNVNTFGQAPEPGQFHAQRQNKQQVQHQTQSPNQKKIAPHKTETELDEIIRKTNPKELAQRIMKDGKLQRQLTREGYQLIFDDFNKFVPKTIRTTYDCRDGKICKPRP